MRALVNPHVRRAAVPAPSDEAAAFHAALPGYAPTPLRSLAGIADELGLAAAGLKDESNRLGLPAFKVLGASWAVERALREAIAAEGAEVVVVDGDYEAVVRRAAAEGERDGVLEIADVGSSGPAHWVIAVEAAAAACLTASPAAGEPVAVPTPGTTMAGLDCAEVSSAAWPSLHDGIHGSVAVSDAEARPAMQELDAAGLTVGECGAAPLAALRALVTEAGCRELRDVAGLGPASRVLLVATEGRTGA